MGLNYVTTLQDFEEITLDNISKVLTKNGYFCSFRDNYIKVVYGLKDHADGQWDIIVNCYLDDWLGILEKYHDGPFVGIVKEPQNLLDWWKSQSYPEFKLFLNKENSYELSLNNEIIAVLPSYLDLSKQIAAIESLIEVFS